MAWFKVDDKLHSHPKRHKAGNAAMGLWVAAGSWSSDQLTDGHIPKHMLPSLGKPAEARALVDAGLWNIDPDDDGWRFHDWQDQNPTRSEVRAAREAENERKRKWREKAQRDRETGQFTDQDGGTQ